jgi:hypothetical protein
VKALLRIAADGRVFRGSNGKFYVEVPCGDHLEVLGLGSNWFRYWLTRRFREECATLPSSESVSRSVQALEAEAAALGSTESVWIRAAAGAGAGGARTGISSTGGDRSGGAIYLDLGDAAWTAVEIRAGGCCLVSHKPVLFRRPKTMWPLPRPEWDGSIDLLKKYTNVSAADFLLLVAWATAALKPVGPYPILVLSGEQGSAKTTMARVIRSVIDPNSALLRAVPASLRDFMVEAHNSWVLAYDNVSVIRPWFSDALCRVSTGGGYSTRALHKDDDETLFEVQRPVILNGIDDFLHRPDLIDRCLCLQALPIAETARRLETELLDELQMDAPRILGALLKAVSGAMQMLPRVAVPAWPRMADFARWGEAVGMALGWPPGAFLAEYQANRRVACISALEDSPLSWAIRELLESGTDDAGGRRPGPRDGDGDGCGRGDGRVSICLTATEMLQLLGRTMPATTSTIRTGHWPKSPRALASMLRRIAPQLRLLDIDVRFDRGRDNRLITISAGRGVGHLEKQA